MPIAQTLPAPLVAFVALFLSSSLAAWIWALRRLSGGQSLLPAAPGRTVPWRFDSVLLVVVLWFMLMTVIPYLTHPWIASPQKADRPADSAQPAMSTVEQLILLAIINSGLIVLVPPLLALTSAARLSDFGFSPGQFGRNALRGVVACLLLAPVVYGINILAYLVWGVRQHPLEQMVRSNPSAPIALLAMVSGVILAPVAEEVVFRGVLQGWLMRVWQRPKASSWHENRDDEPAPPAVENGPPPPPPRRSLADVMPNLVTSAIFAGIHADQWPAPVAIFVLSLGLGVLYQRTGNLVAPLVLHAMFNGISTVGLFASLG